MLAIYLDDEEVTRREIRQELLDSVSKFRKGNPALHTATMRSIVTRGLEARLRMQWQDLGLPIVSMLSARSTNFATRLIPYLKDGRKYNDCHDLNDCLGLVDEMLDCIDMACSDIEKIHPHHAMQTDAIWQANSLSIADRDLDRVWQAKGQGGKGASWHTKKKNATPGKGKKGGKGGFPTRNHDPRATSHFRDAAVKSWADPISRIESDKICEYSVDGTAKGRCSNPVAQKWYFLCRSCYRFAGDMPPGESMRCLDHDGRQRLIKGTHPKSRAPELQGFKLRTQSKKGFTSRPNQARPSHSFKPPFNRSAMNVKMLNNPTKPDAVPGLTPKQCQYIASHVANNLRKDGEYSVNTVTTTFDQELPREQPREGVCEPPRMLQHRPTIHIERNGGNGSMTVMVEQCAEELTTKVATDMANQAISRAATEVVESAAQTTPADNRQCNLDYAALKREDAQGDAEREVNLALQHATSYSELNPYAKSFATQGSTTTSTPPAVASLTEAITAVKDIQKQTSMADQIASEIKALLAMTSLPHSETLPPPRPQVEQAQLEGVAPEQGQRLVWGEDVRRDQQWGYLSDHGHNSSLLPLAVAAAGSIDHVAPAANQPINIFATRDTFGSDEDTDIMEERNDARCRRSFFGGMPGYDAEGYKLEQQLAEDYVPTPAQQDQGYYAPLMSAEDAADMMVQSAPFSPIGEYPHSDSVDMPAHVDTMQVSTTLTTSAHSDVDVCQDGQVPLGPLQRTTSLGSGLQQEEAGTEEALCVLGPLCPEHKRGLRPPTPPLSTTPVLTFKAPPSSTSEVLGVSNEVLTLPNAELESGVWRDNNPDNLVCNESAAETPSRTRTPSAVAGELVPADTDGKVSLDLDKMDLGLSLLSPAPSPTGSPGHTPGPSSTMTRSRTHALTHTASNVDQDSDVSSEEYEEGMEFEKTLKSSVFIRHENKRRKLNLE